MDTPIKTCKSDSAFRDNPPDSSILTSDGHHNLPDIEDYHNKKGCCTQACWNLLSSLCFIGGAMCYIVNAAGAIHLERTYESETQPNGTAPDYGLYYYPDYGLYYYLKNQEIRGPLSWWEFTGALFYILNPTVDFISGAIRAFCLKPTTEMKTKVRPKCLLCIPWDSLGAVLFFVASCLYMVNVIIVKDVYGYPEAYTVISFFASIIFVADAIVYLVGRIVRIQLAVGTDQAKAACCCGKAWTGAVSLDYGLYGDILFLIGAVVEVVDVILYTNVLNLVAQTLWFLDALLYLIEWILVNTTRDGLRYSERSSGKRYSGVSNVSRRRSILDRANSANAAIQNESQAASTREYGTIGVEEC